MTGRQRLSPATKRSAGRRRARPFPLLDDAQDPRSLEARVAFHLHRLGLLGKPLRDCGFCAGYQVHDITQARRILSPKDVTHLARLLGVDVMELTRELTAVEATEWSYYRCSARQAQQVWQRARAAWDQHNYTVTLVARVMGLDRTVVARNSQGRNVRGYRVLPYAAAERLARELGIGEGAAYFLKDGDPSRDPIEPSNL